MPTVLVRVRAAARAHPGVRALIIPGEPARIELVPAPAVQRLHSPQLAVDVAPTPDGVVLRARFGPAPAVWTMYMALVAIALVLAAVAVTFGAAQLVIGEPPVGLYAAGPLLLVAGLIFGAAYVGQGLSSEQMFALRDLLTRAVEGDARDAAGHGGSAPPPADGG